MLNSDVYNFISRPPLGLRPRYIAENHRMLEILEAMQRYVQESKKLPKEWLQELEDLNASQAT